MLDYLGLQAAVVATSGTFQQAQGDPSLVAANQDLLEAGHDPSDIMRLGAVLGPLLAQAGPEPLELSLLRRAADIWNRGLALAEELRTARIEFELSLARHDLPDAMTILQMGLYRLAGLKGPIAAVLGEVRTLKEEVDALAHLPPHPRQSDAATDGWDWSNLFAGRRSLAFVEALRQGAQDRRGHALAAGAVAGHAGHAAGSAFLGAVVGGPRRLHRFRDRLARNSLGIALRRATTGPGFGELARLLRLDMRGDPALPSDLKAQLASALTAAYPGRALPDLDLAHARMIEHLELLSGFVLPDPPEPPPIVEDPNPQPATIETQTFGAPDDQTVGGGTITLGPDTDHESPGVSSQKKAQGDACLYIFLLIATLGLAYLLWCIGRLTTDKKCGVEDFIGAASPDEPAPQATQQTLETLREPANTNHILDDIYQLQIRIWQGFAAARSFLTVCGLIPPNEEELALPLFRQFLEPANDTIWPHREPADAEATYTDRPTTPVEAPAQPVPFPDRGLEWLLHIDPVDNESSFSEIVFAVLRGQERVNLDLDADRGRLHPAWAAAPGSSIADQPLSVAILPFEEQ